MDSRAAGRPLRRIVCAIALATMLLGSGATLLPQTTAVAFAAESAQPSLQLGLNGCTNDVIIDSSITCLLWQRHTVRSDQGNQYNLLLLLRTRPDTEVIVEDDQSGSWPFRGSPLGPPTPVNALGEARIVTQVRTGMPSIKVSVRTRGKKDFVGSVQVRLRWVELSPLDLQVLEKAVHFTDPAEQAGMLARLEEQLARTPAAAKEERLRLLSNLIQLRNAYRREARQKQGSANGHELQKLKEQLQTAVALAMDLRRVRSAARLLTVLAALPTDDVAQRRKVADQLAQLLVQLDALPAEQGELHHQLAELALLDRDLRTAHKHYAEALNAATRLMDASLITRRQARLNRVLFTEGSDIDAELQKQEAQARQHADVCQGSLLLHNLGWIYLLRWESSAGTTRDPAPLFREVLQRSHGPSAICANKARAIKALASLARRLSLPPLSADKDPGTDPQLLTQQAEQAIADARALAAGQTLDYQDETDLLFAKARLSLRKREPVPAEALNLFMELAERTRKDSIIEDRWEAVCGAGVAQLALAPVAAADRRSRRERQLRLLSQCSELLDQHVENIWLTRQASAVDVFGGALGRLLMALHPRDREALLPVLLTTLRRASRRAIAPYRWPLAEQQSPADKTLDKLSKYREQRAQFEARQEQSWPEQIPQRDTPADRERRIGQRRELLELLDAAFVELRQRPAADASWRTLPPPSPTELLLVCHPAGKYVFCITAHEKELRSALLTPEQLARKEDSAAALLSPWRAKLPPIGGGPRAHAPIERVRVLSHGRLREADVADWPVDGQPLIARVPVVYGLDIAPVKIRTGGPGAVMAIHPDGDLGGADATLQMLQSRPFLTALKPRYFSVDVAQFAAAPVNKEPMFGRLYPEHNRAELFAVLGHFRSNLCTRDPSPIGEQSSWLTALCLPGQNSLWAGDVLLAPQIPGTVLLMGCSSARPDAKLSTSAMTMATAYVLRGSRAVLGTVRDIQRPLAQQMLCHLSMDPHFGTARFDLVTAVQQAQRAIATGQPCASGVSLSELGQADWQAFRVYVP